MKRINPSISFEIVTSEIPKTSDIVFLLISKLYRFTINSKQPAATDGGSCVDAKSSL